MPRVLRILNRLIIGGPAINATYLTKYMAPEFETMFVIGGKDDHERDAVHLTRDLDIEPVIIPAMKRSLHPMHDLTSYRRVKELIEEFKPDIVHTHAAKAGIIGRMAAKQCGVPVILHTFHGHVFHSYFNKVKTNMFINVERYMAHISTGIIAISDTQKHELGDIYNICDPEKIQIIPLGLDLNKFQENQEEKRIAFRKEFQIEDDEIAIGIIGRIVPVKNHSLFVAAAAKVMAATNKKVRFVIIGDGDMREQMEMEFRNAQIDYTYFIEEPRKATAVCTSWQTKMDVVLTGLDIVVLTSHNEGTPVSLIEAQAASRPVVSTRVGGVADVVADKVCGLITEPGNAEECAQAILTLVNDAGMRTSFGAKGKEHVMNRFSYQRLVRDMSSYYYQQLEQYARNRN